MSKTEREYRNKLERYRVGINRSTACSANTSACYFDWMNGELAQMDKEKEKSRPGRRPSLRIRLKNLVMVILS